MLDGAKNFDDPGLIVHPDTLDLPSTRSKRPHLRRMDLCLRCFWIALAVSVAIRVLLG